MAAFALTVLVVSLRLYQLGEIPQGLTKDEAYYGYDAYSVLKTGRDIWGARYPLRFKSTGEYKLGLTYLVIPAIKLFDLSELAVRAPSALFGLLTLPVLFMTLRLFSLSTWLSLLMTVIFAFSPWSFGMSRLFYESNVGLFFIALGFYGLARLLSSSSRLWSALSPLSLAISAYFYGPYLYIGGLLLALYLLLSRRLGRSWIIYLLILTPLLFQLSGGSGLKRLSQEWALKMPGYAMQTDNARMNCYLSFGRSPVLAKLCYPFWNKPVNQLYDITLTALRTLSPEFLFFKGVNTYITPEDVGAYPTPLIFLYFFGFIAISRRLNARRTNRTPVIFLLLSLLLSILVVSLPGRLELYRDPVGLYLMFVFFALGASWFVKAVGVFSRPVGLLILAFYALFILFDQSRYLLTYFTSYTRGNSLVFSSDSREVYDYLALHRDYTYLVDRKFHGPIYAAFYWRLDPDYFRDHVDWTAPDPWGWINAKSLGNVYSTEFTLEQLLCLKAKDPSTPLKALVISDPEPIYSQFPSLSTYDANRSLRLHDVYDIDYLYDHLDPGQACH